MGEYFGEILSVEGYELSRFLFYRGLAFIYFIGFLIIKNQYIPLLGRNGLMPIHTFVRHTSFKSHPSLFFSHHGDYLLKGFSYLGLALSLFCLSGLSDQYGLFVSMLCWGALWILYLSYANLGQLFYGYGWESLLLEAGFLAIFLGDFNTPVPWLILWLLRFVNFKNMLGAGLIKLRGDAVWKNLKALFYHFETQPIPNPLSLYFHHLPKVFLKAGVIVNHFIELVVPIFCLVPGSIGTVAALLIILFQFILIVSGNLSWLNYVSIILCIPCIHDDFWIHFLPAMEPVVASSGSAFFYISTTLVGIFLVYRNRYPLKNLCSPYQSMNRSYDPIHLCNTYGAFGSVTKERYELVILGSHETTPSPASWKEYKFHGKPNEPHDRPPIISPYHRRLDWQIWFSAMGTYHQSPWIFVFIHKLLQADPSTLKLLKEDPFQGERPRYIKIDKFQYNMPHPAHRDSCWWKRTYFCEYLPPLDLENPFLLSVIKKLS